MVTSPLDAYVRITGQIDTYVAELPGSASLVFGE
jgi:hypothetical protein